jgi:biopolymer transport protein ExbB/TolQ
MGNILDFLQANFAHVAPILLVGGIALAIILERTKALMLTFPLAHAPKFYEKLRDLIMADRLAEAIAFCDRYKAKPVAHVVREGLLRANQPETLIEDGLQIAVSEATQRIQKRTQFLATIANVATLLGLFGTILGLIQSFEAVGNASAQQRSALLAAGISTAMNATMLGLGVAIPCMVAFSFLMNKTNRLCAEVEQAAIRVMDLIKQRYFAAEAEAVGGKDRAA